MQEIYKKVRGKAIALHLVIGTICVLLGLLMTLGTLIDVFEYMVASDQIFELDEHQMASEKWYRGDNNVLIGAYAEDDYGTYYITMTEDYYYIGFFVPDRMVEKADQIMEAGWQYMDGESWDWSDEYLTGKGYLEPMSYDERALFEEWFEEAGADEEIMEYVKKRTFYLVNPWDKVRMDDDVASVFVGALLLMAGLALIITFFTGGYKKSFRKTLKKNNITEDMLESDMAQAQKKGNIWIGQRYLLALTLPITLIPFDRLVWAYTQVTTTKHRLYGVIPIGSTKSYSLVFVDRDNKAKTVSVKKEEEGVALLKMIYAKAPYIFCGYSDDLVQARQINFRAMIDKVEENKLSAFNTTTFTDQYNETAKNDISQPN